MSSVFAANITDHVVFEIRRGGRVRLKALDSKSSVLLAAAPWVRIPPSPPIKTSHLLWGVFILRQELPANPNLLFIKSICLINKGIVYLMGNSRKYRKTEVKLDEDLPSVSV